ncbi:MAG TPA: glycosyltransferase family 1 protein [Pyrinomonadaceae bacterium]|jgi:UDP-galactopyranose mutase|nr:glycosyltransferase family 1 protein [Pyrinomonadaceae bacterium]
MNKKTRIGLSETKLGSSRALSTSRLDQSTSGSAKEVDLVCFSHLRWDFVYQRPQHLLTRCAQDRRVFFVEEPIFDNGSMRLDVREREAGVQVVVPYLPEGLRSEIATTAVMKEMIRRLFLEHDLREYVFWYYTPMALSFTNHFKPVVAVYDCMDELSAFKGAHSRLPELEKLLFQSVDLVFTGGQSLYDAKRNAHHSVHCFPSSIDVSHFSKARTVMTDPPDQASIPHPRLGFFGVIDERFDIGLLEALARRRPDWHFVMIGPVVKIHPETLPKHANIHYLGPKKYEELPDYLAGWDIALLLFARNESTRFISPTKTPEYLAAGKPVISTSIRDVVRPYGELDLVKIADHPTQFIKAAEKLLAKSQEKTDWLTNVDSFLGEMSWDKTWAQMSTLINQVAERKRRLQAAAVSLPEVKTQSTAAVLG